MKLEAYSIHDSKSAIFSPPFFMRSRGEAIRAFSTTANNPDNNINKFPHDFALYFVGTFDDSEGKLTDMKLENLGLAVQFLTSTDPTPAS